MFYKKVHSCINSKYKFDCRTPWSRWQIPQRASLALAFKIARPPPALANTHALARPPSTPPQLVALLPQPLFALLQESLALALPLA